MCVCACVCFSFSYDCSFRFSFSYTDIGCMQILDVGQLGVTIENEKARSNVTYLLY